MDALQEEKRRMESLPQVRCLKCGRLLFYGLVECVEIKCPKCGQLQ